MTRTLRTTATALLLVTAPVAVGWLRLTRADALPEPLPTHWGPGGEVDGTTTLAAFTTGVLVITGLAAVVGLALLALRNRRTVAPEAIALVGWLGWVFAAVYGQVLLTADGAATAAEVDLSWVAVVAVVGIPTALAAVLWWLLPRVSWAGTVETPSSSMSLAEDERVVWVGRASSVALLVIAVPMLLVGTALVVLVSPEGLVLVGVGGLLALMRSLTVRVDRVAVTVRWGPLPMLRRRLPLETIAAARAEHVEPLRWGGWGYRVSTRGRAAVVRRGPGLVLTLRDGREFAVTVDRPDGAVELVNALVASRADASAADH